MCLCDPRAGITCGAHFVERMRERGKEIERRTVLLAESLIAEAEHLARAAATPTDTKETP